MTNMTDTEYLESEAAIEGSTVDLEEALAGAEGFHFQRIREMHYHWEDSQLREHVSAMLRRSALHDDPACLETAAVAERILEQREREAAR